MTDQTDGVVTLRERVRERLIETMKGASRNGYTSFEDIADAILRDWAIRPVAWGKVGEDGEVEPN